MKSKLTAVGVVCLLSMAVWQGGTTLEVRPSIKEELTHLVSMRDGGLISQREYNMLKRHVLDRMLH